ncbi:hypothetical protein PF005_g13933 [Phytophthora fragariae]|uniref:Transmembrane protein n=1 Tax=Phytophthora fragariae TaxID=53985 RepID=A0A6A3TS81_9STRA|nr:hypothetical protein PF011_g15839 [Phytophthora fragariae]KAE9096179.1 hypothetical protein PF010_g16441 [Phytophthora fragariae]KAE9141635.1 hypothetical protein PF006_g13132 [Phytophthora fragariae]KAE9204068.1 hypothetical protein PF005_g13933 [Phytophthora fragariae]KAE9246539.1 hypothetical protein PF004_g4762 [Phytophthora fragariae]
MMPLSSPPRSASAPSYRAAEPFPPPQRLYQAAAEFSPLFSDAQPQTLSSYRPRRRVTVVRRPAGCNLVRPCALASRITRMLLFNGCSAVLSVMGALVVWPGAALAVVTMPLLGCGVVVFEKLLRVAFFLCCTDAFIYNALAASAADCIDMDVAEWGVSASSSNELPRCCRFECRRRSEEQTDRSVLATVCFGCFKVLVGAAQMLAVGAVVGVLGFLIGDKRVPVHLDALSTQYPFSVYTTAFGLLLVALAMLHGVTRVSKVVTRFFCCETVR